MTTRRIVPLVVVSALLLGSLGSSAQQAAATSPVPRFEAVSIRPSDRNDPRGLISAWQFFPSGDVQFRNATLHLIVTLAHTSDTRFSDILILGPQPVLQQRFDIQAKATGGTGEPLPARPTAELSRQRLQRMLAERFAFRSHTEMREIPAYALTLIRPGRFGRNLREATVDCTGYDYTEAMKDRAKACGLRIRRDQQQARLRESGPLGLLVRLLEQNFTDRPLEDQTGLKGLYEWDMTFAVERNPAVDTQFPSLETALADDLGLRLVPTTAIREVRVIDHIEPPTEN